MLGIGFFHASANADSMDCSAGRLLEKARTEVLIVAAAVAEQGRRVREALLSMRLGDGGWDSLRQQWRRRTRRRWSRGSGKQRVGQAERGGEQRGLSGRIKYVVAYSWVEHPSRAHGSPTRLNHLSERRHGSSQDFKDSIVTEHPIATLAPFGIYLGRNSGELTVPRVWVWSKQT
ncbi:hypothetical protein Scep_001543 [Stephania cephalantha]|uniref:Uncharacterized protein n=1 Tax=Stephania cephalantha TaxID=152367 RepID=A0AAP0L9L1_9MAGN